jgi:hypothetical protein
VAGTLKHLEVTLRSTISSRQISDHFGAKNLNIAMKFLKNIKLFNIKHTMMADLIEILEVIDKWKNKQYGKTQVNNALLP